MSLESRTGLFRMKAIKVSLNDPLKGIACATSCGCEIDSFTCACACTAEACACACGCACA